MKKITFACISLSICCNALAHSGATDKNGCHDDRKNGTCHCH